MSVTLHTTHGDLKLELFCDSVPHTAENFLALCASHYYDASPIHRNIPSFMFQTGGPAASRVSASNPKAGASIWHAPFADEIRPGLRHNARGIVSMANKGPGTNGSQFFVTYAPAPHLDGKNSVFGRVIEGVDTTLDALEGVECDAKGRPTGKCRIEGVSIHANPLAG
ncbi:Peptidyl-prolyl cis-trans isomerase-like 3 [Cryomyces minteri]|uniref:Peptidyl-prolyl cis-trans isomerase n=1 Tax=Cryomyces minteri TaxID=331657 RepID=A0A4U0XNC1_9PEZI|nr:Peptidyl-prolyl cis-trans isomerase-like 3 [Cryomyces minteri]TKA80937.1 Peptidyl-prolyl cis-trans isomerase-like 3 [Cryomyces minteri]